MGSTFFAIIFFAMMITLGLDSTVGTMYLKAYNLTRNCLPDKTRLLFPVSTIINDFVVGLFLCLFFVVISN